MWNAKACRSPGTGNSDGPVFDIEGMPHVLVTQFMAALRCTMLKTQVFSAQDRAHEVVAALACLFQEV